MSLNDPLLELTRVTEALPVKFLQANHVFPLKQDAQRVAVVMADPLDVYTVDSIRMRLNREVEVYLGDEQDIAKALDRCYEAGSTMETIAREVSTDDPSADETDDVAHLTDLASEAPVIRLVNLIIARAVEDRASDIHIEPFEGPLRVRYRIDGLLVDREAPPRRLQAAVMSRIKLMAKMNIAERRLPQDGRIRTVVEGRDLDIRVSTIPTVYGESVVMRLLDRSNLQLGLDQLGFGSDHQSAFEGLIKRPHGIILVTGPTGSGKTTTLYSALQTINSVERKIITVEDPVEYQLHGINQIQVKPSIGLTFASGLRHILRQDPDVILVGEIRDRETAEIAIHAALTGHLVLSTLHTNDAASAVTRLLEMGIEPYLVTSTLLAVLAQRLVRKICVHCRAPLALEGRGSAAEEGGQVLAAQAGFYGRGCPDCRDQGFRGRIGIYELLVMRDELRAAMLHQSDANAIRDRAIAGGMRTLWQDGWEKVIAGVTTRDELLRVTQES
ncbi:MAG: type II secretion system protein GspE [Verrucomicrobia bacterium]|nr:type II secretion system protein GspE [Verrucomicrobiota bacterium]